MATNVRQLEQALVQTQADLASVTHTLGTLIAWIVQSANSPLSHANATRLLEMLPPENGKKS